MKSLWLKSGAVASTTLWSVAALSATPSTATVPASPALSGKSTSASSNVATEKKAPLPISITSSNTWYGPSADSIGSHYSHDGEINAKFPMTIRNQFGFGYKLSDKMTIKPTIEFDLITADAGSDAQNEGFHWRDSFVQLSRSSLVEADLGSNKFALDGVARWYVPSSKASRDTNQIGSVRFELNPSIQFGKSAWSLSMQNYVRYYMLTQTENSKADPLNRWLLYTGPQINYEFNDKVTAFVLYEAYTNVNTKGAFDVARYAVSNTDIEPGLNLNLHERLQLSPALNWYTNQPLSTTSLLLNASIKLL